MQTMTEDRLELEMFPSELVIPTSKWYKLRRLMPWREIEELLAPLFQESGRNAIPVRHIIGALIIQTDKNLTDRETMETIMETPMLQYFLGLDSYIMEPLFDFSLLSKYRKRIGADKAKAMIDTLLDSQKIQKAAAKDKTHRGSMSIDATAVPVNITYPTDLKLLNETRVQTERLIDEGHAASGETTKPRTYRQKARSEYLQAAKSKRLSHPKRRATLRAQLQYVRRNLKTLATKLGEAIYPFDEAQLETLATCKTIYDQQKRMYETKTKRHADRIVNFHQPHIRCIVRGKAGKPFEFGPKIAVSKINGFIHLDEISFTNFNESGTVPNLIEKYRTLHGVYPEAIRADQIYQTRANKTYCKKLGIRLSGKPLGRPRKDKDDHEEKRIMEDDFKKRLEIEGVFGVAKTKYGLSKLMTRLPESQKASIGLVFFVMNLNQLLSFTPFSETLETLFLPIDYNEIEYVFEEERASIEIIG